MKFSKNNLKNNGKLIIYGPMNIDGKFTSESNEKFNSSLIERDKDWGIRDIDDVKKFAKFNSLKLIETINMPNNNFILIFEKFTF
jgi:hypothetical protein